MWTSILLSNSLWYVKYPITHIKNYSGQVIKLMVWLHSCNVYTESLFQEQKYCTSQQNNNDKTSIRPHFIILDGTWACKSWRSWLKRQKKLLQALQLKGSSTHLLKQNKLPVEVWTPSDCVVTVMLAVFLIAVIFQRIRPQKITHWTKGWGLSESINLQRVHFC